MAAISGNSYPCSETKASDACNANSQCMVPHALKHGQHSPQQSPQIRQPSQYQIP